MLQARVVVIQVQDAALCLAESHAICLGPRIQPVQIPLRSLPTVQQINTPNQPGVVYELTESALNSLVPITDEDFKQG